MAYDKKTFLSGLAMGLCGKGEPVSDMGGVSWSYNGVELPKLPKWDKEAYPYAVLKTKYLFSDKTLSQLYISSVPATFYPNAEGDTEDTWLFFMYDEKHSFMNYIIFWRNGEENWRLDQSGEAESYRLEIYDGIYPDDCWANHDVISSVDGSIYLAASDPVPDTFSKGYSVGAELRRKRNGILLDEWDISEAQDGSLIAKVIEYTNGEIELRISGNGVPENFFNGSQPWYDDYVYYSSEKRITSGYVEDGVEYLPWYCFGSCSVMTQVRLPDSLIEIPRGCFTGCSQLEAVGIPSNVETLGLGAFSECYALAEVVVPESVKVISGQVFYECNSLTKVTFNEGLTSIGVDGLDGSLNGVFTRSKLSGFIELPSTLTAIGALTFEHYYNTEIHLFIPNSVTSIVSKNSSSGGYRNNSICFNGPTNIYCEATSRPSGWPTGWNYVNSDGETAPTTWGVTREEFRALAGEN